MEDRLQYGPYSPQEVDRISTWLQQNNIRFELVRDDQEAKEALMNDGQNVINLAEFRTKVYLAQVFYIALIAPSDEVQKKFENLFSLKAEVFADERFRQVENDDQSLAQGKLKQQRKKRGWAIILALYLIVPIIVSLVMILLKKES